MPGSGSSGRVNHYPKSFHKNITTHTLLGWAEAYPTTPHIQTFQEAHGGPGPGTTWMYISIHYKDKDTRALALQDTDEQQADRKVIYLLSW